VHQFPLLWSSVRGILPNIQKNPDIRSPACFSQALLRFGVTQVYPRLMLFDKRPWGSFTVLDEADGYKVKRIEVLPEKRLSYQKHEHRSEHWIVVAGTAKVTLDGREIVVETGGTIDIPVKAAHRIENLGREKMVFIEVQRGAYLGEDDIQRLQDDYGRTQ
jgi:mannose-6-phosphate isomerase